MKSEQKTSKIYFDANAGAPPSLIVREGLSAFLRDQPEVFSNPSSVHSSGRVAKKALRDATESIALSLGAETSDLIFTSCGSEANQLAIRSFVESMREGDSSAQPFHFITSKVEHDCIREMVPWIEKQGGRISYLPLTEGGAPDFSKTEDLIRSSEIPAVRTLAAVIWVNNETGVITPLETSSLNSLRSRGLKVHLDAAQAWGKLLFSVSQIPADTLAFAGHKLGAYSGVGVLWSRSRKQIHPMIWGSQQKSQRGGTENMVGILSLGLAVHKADFAARIQYVQSLKETFESLLIQRIPGVRIHGARAPRVGNTTYFCIAGFSKVNWTQLLDVEGIQVSSGSACAAALPEPSHVLLEMGVPTDLARASVRVSFSDQNTETEVERLIATLETLMERLQRQ